MLKSIFFCGCFFFVGTIFSQNHAEKIHALAKKIKFQHSQSIELTEESFKVLDTLATLFKDTNDTYRIVSYSGMRGKASDNLIKTQKRAKVIEQELLKRGIDLQRFVFVGLGEANRIASAPRTRGKSLNERIEIEILAK
jgi:outer membrane protein OmpA-like peptidoglycan-associated protein